MKAGLTMDVPSLRSGGWLKWSACVARGPCRVRRGRRGQYHCPSSFAVSRSGCCCQSCWRQRRSTGRHDSWHELMGRPGSRCADDRLRST